MAKRNLEILVLLRETCDPRPPAMISGEGAAIRDRGIRRIPNPADLCALEEALCLADSLGARVTAFAVGSRRLDDLLRLAHSMGAARLLRIFDPALEGGDATADSRVLARILEILRPDLFFTGGRLLDRGDDPAPALAAAALGIPYVTAAVSVGAGDGDTYVLRKGDRGARQRVKAALPCAVFFDVGLREPRYPGYDAVMDSLDAIVEVWRSPDLGLPTRELGASGARLLPGEYSFPRFDPLRVVTPDPSLPAFERILALLSGGIRPREGRLHFVTASDAAEGLFRIFCAAGLIQGPPE